jgi:phage N-6-adenine-methyltransferase
MTAQIERLAAAERMLAEIAEQPTDVAKAEKAGNTVRFAEAARVWAQEAKLGTSSVNHATVIKLRAERRMAEAVRSGQKTGQIAKPGRPVKPPTPGGFTPPTLEDIGVRQQRLAEANKILDKFSEEDLIELKREFDERDEVLSRTDLIAKPKGKLISQSGGSEHWYTPLPHIEAARSVLGGIDLDPASSDVANRTIRAERYYTEQDDGLSQPWRGRVWMNPPYGEPAGQFVARLAQHLGDGSVPAAVVLVSLHAMSAGWFEPLYNGILCVTSGRLKFTDEEGNAGSPTFGSVFAYFGPAEHEFAKRFAAFGHILAAWD